MRKGETRDESRIVTFRIPQNLLGKLDAMAKQEGRSRGNLIRLLIEKAMHGKKGKG
jgi:metal-responsive CopG/Arc/MetJ family transcriptional regulator